jgi:arginyl-tRNA synthetase
MNVLQTLQQKLHDALAGLVPDPAKYAQLVKPTQDPRFGDYQANCAMPLKAVLGKKNPREAAEEIVRRLDLGDMLGPPEVAGSGFINLRLRPGWLASQLRAMAGDERLGVGKVGGPKTIVVDYSSPNVAKPMHVGHLRSTIIGDSLTRLLRFLGHRVITDNHVGDWGTQFGMLLYGYKHFRDEGAWQADPVQEMVRVYVRVRQQVKPAEEVEDDPKAAPKYTEDELAGGRRVLEAVRAETAKLHAGDPENRALWEKFMPWSYREIEGVYARLGVLPFDHRHGESFYQPMLAEVVEDFLRRGLAVVSEGAVVLPPPGYPGTARQWLAEVGPLPPEEKRKRPPPVIIRKSDGAFTYTTSDLATIQYRVREWHPDAILYVVGLPQRLHFQQLFDAARRWGYDRVELHHIAFGSVLGPDGKPLRTREGGVPLLDELLDEAVREAAKVYERVRQERIARGEEVPELSPEELRAVHEAVGIGAVKYADLSQNRESDYKFVPAKMTATEGNTATYMQYAYVRNMGIFRKGGVDPQALRADPPLPPLGTPHERALGVQLLRLEETLAAASADYRPNLITAYLWDLARAYSGFFENCPVLKAPTPELRAGRLLLCDLTARVIRLGLHLLGIGIIERM